MSNLINKSEEKRTKVALFLYSIFLSESDAFFSLPLYYNVETVVKFILQPNFLITPDFKYVLNDDDRPQLEGEYNNIEDYPNYSPDDKFSAWDDILLDMEIKHRELIEEGFNYFIYQAPNEVLSKFFLGKDRIYDLKYSKYFYLENILQVPVSIRFPNSYFIVGDNSLPDLEGNPNGVLNRVFNLYRFYDNNITYDYSLIHNGLAFYNISQNYDIYIGGQQYSPINGKFNYESYFSQEAKPGFQPLFKPKSSHKNLLHLTNLSNNNPNLVLCIVEEGDLEAEYRFNEFKKVCEANTKKITVYRYNVVYNNDNEIFEGITKKGKNELDLFFQVLNIQLDCSLKKICLGACINKERWSIFHKTIHTISVGKLLALQIKKKEIEKMKIIDFLNNLVLDNYDISYYVQNVNGIDEKKHPGLPLAINISRRDRLSLINIYWEPTKVKDEKGKYPPLPIRCIQMYGNQFIFPTKFLIDNKCFENGEIEDYDVDKLNNLATQENFCGFISLNTQSQRINYCGTQNNRFILDNEKNFVTSFLQISILAPNSFENKEFLIIPNQRSLTDKSLPDTDWPIFRPEDQLDNE